MATLQFRLAFKDKGHKSLEHWCLVIHLTFVISTISNAESNAGIFILIGPLLIMRESNRNLDIPPPGIPGEFACLVFEGGGNLTFFFWWKVGNLLRGSGI